MSALPPSQVVRHARAISFLHGCHAPQPEPLVTQQQLLGQPRSGVCNALRRHPNLSEPAMPPEPVFPRVFANLAWPATRTCPWRPNYIGLLIHFHALIKDK